MTDNTTPKNPNAESASGKLADFESAIVGSNPTSATTPPQQKKCQKCGAPAGGANGIGQGPVSCGHCPQQKESEKLTKFGKIVQGYILDDGIQSMNTWSPDDKNYYFTPSELALHNEEIAKEAARKAVEFTWNEAFVCDSDSGSCSPSLEAVLKAFESYWESLKEKKP